jgi:hypothetical protein
MFPDNAGTDSVQTQQCSVREGIETVTEGHGGLGLTTAGASVTVAHGGQTAARPRVPRPVVLCMDLPRSGSSTTNLLPNARGDDG